MRKTAPETQAGDLADFFSASEARTDRRRQLSAIGRGWESAVAAGGRTSTGPASPSCSGSQAEIHGYHAAHGLKLLKPAAYKSVGSRA